MLRALCIKKALSTVLVFGWCVVSLGGPAEAFERRAMFSLDAADCPTFRDVFDRLSALARVPVHVIDDPHSTGSSWASQPCLFIARFHGVPLREPLSWFLHLADATATVSNGTVVIRGPAENLSRSSAFPLVTEERLIPLTDLDQFVGKGTVSSEVADWGVAMLVERLCYAGNVPVFVIAPSVVTNAATVRVAFSNEPISRALMTVLKRGGVFCSSRAGCLHFTSISTSDE